ncbi:sortase-associated OmpA-like protein PdsO [Alteromonas sp. McT4-15]|uniref:sortase-associated OmpA-like protein PdsO n=1 Tax=Alteromonas sp. McT4-15 TaxID=2881256 RepID=UPI001CF857EB|nr:sortase-associated OmpA-like protein PdsO [Alteromonas sp. McT4-15]MCB4437706.1 sortase-associated OmpA-like protein PdsO [Alteromonas sp. McT4-15]
MRNNKALASAVLIAMTTLSINAAAASRMASSDSTPVNMQAQKEKESKAAAVGLGSGVVVGAIIAGPAGAAVAGILGALIGENTAQETALNESHAELAELAYVQQENSTLREENHAMQQQLMLTKVAYEEELSHAPAPTLKSSIQFKSGSVIVEPVYGDQLALVASALKGNEKLTVRLTGQADKRGDSQFNQALSMQRALSVKKYLTELGVASEQIMTVAVGESQSMQTEHEGIFFDRKVEMEIAERAPVLMSQNAQ